MGMCIALRNLLMGGLLLVTADSYAGDGHAVSLDWLKTVAFAAHQTEYSGVFVYQYDNRVETFRITHVVEPDSEYERLESLDGPRREIIRHHGQVWWYANQKMTQMSCPQTRNRFPSLLPEQLSTLSENYQARDAGMERVAGYNTQAILFQPNDNLRYIHKIWIHTDSGLLLKAAVLRNKNQIIEQYAFTQLQISGDIDHSWIKPGTSEGLRAGPPTPEPATGSTPVNSGWTVGALPAGFKKTMEILRPMPGKQALVTQLVFSDGLSAISIFIEPPDEDEDYVEGLSSRGAVSLYHKVINGHLINVVGDVSPRAVIQVLDSVRYNGK